MPPTAQADAAVDAKAVVEGLLVTTSLFVAGSFFLTYIVFLHVRIFLQRRKKTQDSALLVIVLVGLPARGKSFVSRKVSSSFGLGI